MQDLADSSGGSGAGIDDTVTANDSTWSSNKITSVISSEISNYNTDLRGGYSGTMKDLYDAIDNSTPPAVSSVDPTTPRLIMTINDENVSSSYDYDLNTLHKVLQRADWGSYIKSGDYINLTTKNGDVFKMIFNVNTYYERNGTGSTISTHHIDMISENLIPNSYWKMRTTDKNNGTAEQQNPYLASNEANCVQTNLADYYTNNIPTVLKSYIVKKKLVVPYRYQSGSTLKNDNGSGLEELPELWIPFEKEAGLGDAGSYETDMITYPIFIDDNSRVKKKGGSATRWWLASATPNFSTGFYVVDSNGSNYYINYGNASYSYYVPLCFRFV